ncbi:hypothetical protein [Photobacterium leiognathi]|uniref:hypothetical protein n=1 Tax=Photobacterium leiognathi TaxID=553611 RepID=UPI0029815801|nr:hypothetical protein [Photobacterium leiognathi]
MKPSDTFIEKIKRGIVTIFIGYGLLRNGVSIDMEIQHIVCSSGVDNDEKKAFKECSQSKTDFSFNYKSFQKQ